MDEIGKRGIAFFLEGYHAIPRFGGQDLLDDDEKLLTSIHQAVPQV